MLVPGLTRDSATRILSALSLATGLSEQAVTAAFMDADRGRAALLDPMRHIRRAAYRAAAQGVRDDAPVVAQLRGQQVIATIASAHALPVDVAGMLLGAAFGLRLGLDARLARKRQPKRPTLTARVAKLTARDVQADLDAARALARDLARVANGSVRRRKGA